MLPFIPPYKQSACICAVMLPTCVAHAVLDPLSQTNTRYINDEQVKSRLRFPSEVWDLNLKKSQWFRGSATARMHKKQTENLLLIC